MKRNRGQVQRKRRDRKAKARRFGRESTYARTRRVERKRMIEGVGK
jgi:hypothetical protein